MPVFAILGVIFLLAFLTESLVEYIFGTVIDHVPLLQPYGWLLMYISAAVGITGAFVYQFDLISLVGNFFGVAIPINNLGLILSGLAIGRGANYLHDLVSKFFVKPTPPPQP